MLLDFKMWSDSLSSGTFLPNKNFSYKVYFFLASQLKMVRRKYETTEKEQQEEIALAKRLFGDVRSPSDVDISSESDIEDHNATTSDHLEDNFAADESQSCEIHKQVVGCTTFFYNFKNVYRSTF